MGRRAKYFTLEERRHAVKARRAAKVQTAYGTEARKSQNRTAYQRRKDQQHEQSPPESKLTRFPIPRLSSLMLDQAQFQLPSSVLFRLAFGGKDELEFTGFEEEELSKWKNLPPYSLGCEGKDSNWLDDNFQDLTDALHGWRLREQREYENSRLKRYRLMPLEEFTCELHSDLLRWIKDWEQTNEHMRRYEGDEVEAMLGLQLVWWTARRCVHLFEDFEALLKGHDTILNTYVERWISTTQC